MNDSTLVTDLEQAVSFQEHWLQRPDLCLCNECCTTWLEAVSDD